MLHWPLNSRPGVMEITKECDEEGKAYHGLDRQTMLPINMVHSSN